MNTADHLVEWNDLCAGLALLYMGPHGHPGAEIGRLMHAMDTSNLDGMDHVSALLLIRLMIQGKDLGCIKEKWLALDKEYHRQYCLDTHCISLRGGGTTE